LTQISAHAGIILLAPDSRGATWDDLPAAQGSFGPDVAFINAALGQTFALYNIDATKLGIQGFSDGATYALGLGETQVCVGTTTLHPCGFGIRGITPLLVYLLCITVYAFSLLSRPGVHNFVDTERCCVTDTLHCCSKPHLRRCTLASIEIGVQV